MDLGHPSIQQSEECSPPPPAYTDTSRVDSDIDSDEYAVSDCPAPSRTSDADTSASDTTSNDAAVLALDTSPPDANDTSPALDTVAVWLDTIYRARAK